MKRSINSDSFLSNDYTKLQKKNVPKLFFYVSYQTKATENKKSYYESSMKRSINSDSSLKKKLDKVWRKLYGT